MTNHNFVVSNPLYLFWPFKLLVNHPFPYFTQFSNLAFVFRENFLSFSSFQEFINGSQTKVYLICHKLDKGESPKIPGSETLNSSISSPLAVVEVLKSWFENHMAFGKWIDVFKHRSVSFVDMLNYNFFLFEDFEIFSAYIESTPGKLLDLGSVSFPILVKIFLQSIFHNS